MPNKPLIAGNWKMNGTKAALDELRAMGADGADLFARVDLLVCPPATLIEAAVEVAGPIAIGGQTCHPAEKGAHTGEISAEMLADAGASFVILGHSERRADNHESDADVSSRVDAARRAGLTVVVCVGETEAQRDAGQTLDVLGVQMAGSIPADAIAGDLVVAYEPVWAIGTGRTPSVAEVAEVHAFLRQRLVERFGDGAGRGVRILYGGSVKPENASQLLSVADVDGALVGGASLKAKDFIAICRAAAGIGRAS